MGQIKMRKCKKMKRKSAIKFRVTEASGYSEHLPLVLLDVFIA